jgi:uncharacterized protein involved in cysteine biosynthesis
MNRLLGPLGRAVAQIGDPVFVGVLWRSIIWSALCFIGIFAGAVWAVHHLFEVQGAWRWLADLLSGVGTALLALWLFLPVAVVIGTLYIERVASSVERRYYPALPPPRGAPLTVQFWDGIAVGARVLLMNVVALALALLIPGIGLLLAWAIAAYAIGRGLFVAVAMRRMGRPEAEAAYRRQRLTVLVQGGLMALASYVPLLNLLLPVLGTAVMVHVLDDALASAGRVGGA